uniref:Uncharacterized protein n=1 Tax=Arundo donax TaxID=35708 RepID=A0A0A8Y7V2_ARUDO
MILSLIMIDICFTVVFSMLVMSICT